MFYFCGHVRQVGGHLERFRLTMPLDLTTAAVKQAALLVVGSENEIHQYELPPSHKMHVIEVMNWQDWRAHKAWIKREAPGRTSIREVVRRDRSEADCETGQGPLGLAFDETGRIVNADEYLPYLRGLDRVKIVEVFSAPEGIVWRFTDLGREHVSEGTLPDGPFEDLLH